MHTQKIYKSVRFIYMYFVTSNSSSTKKMGEKMIWLAQKKNNVIYHIESSYQRPLMSIYIKDGASAVLGMKLTPSDSLKPVTLLTE